MEFAILANQNEIIEKIKEEYKEFIIYKTRIPVFDELPNLSNKFHELRAKLKNVKNLRKNISSWSLKQNNKGKFIIEC